MTFKDLKIGQIFSFKQKSDYDPDAKWIKTGEGLSWNEIFYKIDDLPYNAVLLTSQPINFKEYYLVPTGLCVNEDEVEEVFS